MIGWNTSSMAVDLATLVVPIAVYFLVLGLLNSRRHPQMLTGRSDFALLLLAISPLFVLPVLEAFAYSPAAIVLSVVGVAAGVLLLAPRGRVYVLYNLFQDDARRLVDRVLNRLDLPAEPTAGGFDLGRDGRVSIGGFPLLRNVSIRLEDGAEEHAAEFQAALGEEIARVEAPANSMAVALLLLATAMLVAPVTLVAHTSVPQLVRLLKDLLH